MRPALWRHLYEVFRSTRADVRHRCTEALGAIRTWWWSIKTSDRARHWLDQTSAQVVASTVAAYLVWLLTRGR